MKSIKNSVYLLIISFLFMNAKCNNEKMLYVEKPSFEIIEATTQLLIPGLENEKPQLEISIKIDETASSFLVDSIYYQNIKALKPRKNGNTWTVKISNKQAKNISEYNGASLQDKIVLFYSENTTSNFTLINKIYNKEPLYLP